MAWDYVSVERQGPVAIVRFDRKARLNAFDQKLIRELTEAARSFEEDDETRAVVLTGSAEAFSSGFDLKDPENFDESQDDVKKRRRFYAGVRMCRAWEDMPQVTVCAIERLAVGGGAALPLFCDWRVMGRSAYLYVPEVMIGMNLQWGSLPRLITLVGPSKAKQVVLLCEKMGAEMALDWGLVDRLAEDGQAVEEALKLARRAAEMPAATVRMVKEAVNATAGALHRATSFADADQSQLTRGFEAMRTARERFSKD